MGGGDLNMKKSWHPLLMKNQERVWLEEKKALEERKKLEQLRKEKEEERQLQDLQRLQEEQTGRKRTEKLEWMYATPATGSGTNSNDLEDYLLGKKRVDKILVGDENQALGASHKNFIAVQHANTVRDTAAKVREDPLFMIKQQEQAALQALRDNPLRLREMQERNGLVPRSTRREKEKKKHKRRSRSPRHQEQRLGRSRSPRHREQRLGRSYSMSPPRRSRSQVRRDSLPHSYRRSESRSEHGSRSPEGRRRYYERDEYDRSTRHRNHSYRHESRSPPDGYEHGGRSRGYQTESNHMSHKETEHARRPLEPSGFKPPPRVDEPAPSIGENGLSRADKLAAMVVNATEASEERKKRLTQRLAEESAELELENQLRSKSRGASSFISGQQKLIYGGMEGGLGDYMRRGRMGLAVERD